MKQYLWFVLCLISCNLTIFGRVVSTKEHDGAKEERNSRQLRPEAATEEGKIFLSPKKFGWRCGNLPESPDSDQKYYLILAMIEMDQGRPQPAKHGSPNAECALLKVESGQVTQRIQEGIKVGDTTVQSLIPGALLGKVGDDQKKTYILINSDKKGEPPSFVVAPCTNEDKSAFVGTVKEGQSFHIPRKKILDEFGVKSGQLEESSI